MHGEGRKKKKKETQEAWVGLPISGNGVGPKQHRLDSHPGFCNGDRERGRRVSASVLP